MISIIAFCVLAFMFAAFTLLDGYDLGAGAVSLIVAKTRAERGAIFESIGPFWSGNEVWLVAGGGALFALFPQAYAVAFSGFYLPFIIVLWLLMFRGIAIELREHLPSQIWMDFWDVAFSISSALLILLLGVALGNLVRGLPLDQNGYFSGTFSMLLNPYAVAVGVLAVLALAQHGLAYVAMRVEGTLAGRALRDIGRVWWPVIVVYVVVTAATLVDHHGAVGATSLSIAACVVALAALVALRGFADRRRAEMTFRASLVFLSGLLVAAAATIYPYVIPPYPRDANGLTIFQASPSPVALTISVIVAVVGLVFVIVYSIFVRRRMSAKVHVHEEQAA